VQRSRSDERHGREGSRAYYWSKDLQAKPATFAVTESHLLAFVDVDQYIDMPHLLCTEFKPCLVYTFQPYKAASIEPEYSYTFGPDNIVDYRVKGGARYQHGVWNYSVDNLVVVEYWFIFPTTTTTYLVDRRQTSNNHDLVLLTPVKRWTGLLAPWLASYLNGSELARLNLYDAGYLRLKVQGESVMMSTARVNEYSCATVKVTTDEAVSAVSRVSKLDLTLPQVIKQVTDAGEKIETSAALVLQEYHREQTGGKPPFVYPVHCSLKSYTFVESGHVDVKPSLVPFMPPMMPECWSPTDDPANERRAVASRITEIKKLPVHMTGFLIKVIDEFNHHLFPVPHVLTPAEYDEVHRRQDRPTQRRILLEGETTNTTRIVQSFLKKETYDNPNDPRVITTINPNDKLEYSAIIYPIADVLIEQDWYAFGKTPLGIATQVVRVCSDSTTQHVALGDFSRMDGHSNEIDREADKMLAVRAYKPEYHDRVLERMSSQYDVKGFGRHGTQYASGKARLSGSPETAAFNSIITARVVYTGFRKTIDPNTGDFHTPKEAWRKLCRLSMLGGDDSIVAELSAEVLTASAAMYGQVLEVDIVRRGEWGINFLSRFYTDRVWYGELSSTCDLQRQLRKFHVSTRLPPNVTPVMKLVEKCRAFCMGDQNTPILGPISRYVSLAASDRDMSLTDDLRIWSFSDDLSEQYPNQISGGDVTHILAHAKIEPYAETKLKLFLDDRPTLEQIVTEMPLLVEPKQEEPKLKGAVLVDDGNAPVVLEPTNVASSTKDVVGPKPTPEPKAKSRKVKGDTKPDRTFRKGRLPVRNERPDRGKRPERAAVTKK
jgi:hypothetical protein